MLSDKLTILERNRYFFGKLLTADDFNAEQNYFNSKRRLINRLTFGAGVVCGLTATRVDDVTLEVESGFAFDYSGREVVLPHSIVSKLKDIEGFGSLDRQDDQSLKSVYLCARYDEESIDPVHSVAKTVLEDESEGSDYNRVRESCKLFLTGVEPKEHPSEVYDAARMYVAVFSAEGVEISVSAPRYVCPNQEFFIETKVNKGAPQQQIVFEMKLELSFLTANGQHTADISFFENKYDTREEYILRTPVRASTSLAEAQVRIADLSVSINDVRRTGEPKAGRITIVEDKNNATAEYLRKRSLGEALSARSNIYLARLCLTATAEGFCIGSIEDLPFEQTAFTPMQNGSLQLLHGQLPHKDRPRPQPTPPLPVAQPAFRSGNITVSVPSKNSKDDVFYSSTVPHFLGTGEVLVTVGHTDGEDCFFGTNVFDRSIEWGVKTDKLRGLFCVAVKLKKSMPAGELTFDWYAAKTPEPMPEPKNQLRLYPNVYYAHPYETIAFEASAVGGIRGELVWSVAPETGGKISRKGVFTASGNPGFYEIQAQTKDGGMYATAFVVI